jgi:hypothetical protein
MDRLAQELIDEIIDHWQLLDPNSMRPCGLIGKRWLPRSRHHLFSSVYLTKNNLQTFIDILNTSALLILPSIRTIILCYQDTLHDDEHLKRLHNCPNLVQIVLRSGTRVSGGMTSQWFGSTELQAHIRAWTKYSPAFSQLDLEFHSFGRVEMTTIAHILSCVPSLQSLRMRGIRIEAKSPMPLYFPPCLVHLDLGTVIGGEIFLAWLGSLDRLPILQSLEYYLLYMEPQLIEPYFQRAGSGLKSMILGLDEEHPCKYISSAKLFLLADIHRI